MANLTNQGLVVWPFIYNNEE